MGRARPGPALSRWRKGWRTPTRATLTEQVRERSFVSLAIRPRPAVRCRHSGGDLPREREVGDAAGGGDRLDVVGVLEGLQAVPDADAAAEHDRDLDEMHVVDEPGGEEVTNDAGAAADPDVLAIGCFAGGLERLGRGGVEEVERGAALHLDRGPRAVSEHEGRCVKRRVRAPPALPVRVVPPAGWAELVGAHDLGADAVTVALSKGVVDSGGSAGIPEPGTEHPLVQTLARVAERCIGGLRLAGGEAVEGDGQVVDPGE